MGWKIGKALKDVGNVIGEAIRNVISKSLALAGQAYQKGHQLIRVFFIAGIIVGIITAIISEILKEKDKKPEEDLIVGIEVVPYHVSIQFKGKHVCSGTLIGKKYVLTLASCIAKYHDAIKDKEKLKIYVGEREVPDRGPFYRVDRVKVHPDFDYTSHNSDIGLLKLRTEVTTSIHAVPIGLPNNGSKTPHKLEIFISGYDNFGIDDRLDDRRILHGSRMKIISSNKCEEKFFYHGNMSDFFCAVPSRRYINCVGNPGSPATVQKKYVIGIYTMRGKCYRQNDPELFTRIPPFLKFIKSAMD